jgi:group I intron endonuclease
MTCGIYLLGFTNTEKVYVGQSTNIEKRFLAHCNDLRKGTHTARLNFAFLNYGLPELEILEICNKERLNELEKIHISLWHAVTNGFNYLHLPGGGSCKGEHNSRSLYKDSQIISLVDHILINCNSSLVTISEETGISYNVVKNIVSGKSHTWLQDILPEKYAKLMGLLGTRSNKGERQGSAVYSNSQIYTAFKELLNNITSPNSVIALLGTYST